MNHIKKLEHNVRIQKEAIEAIKQEIVDLRAHLYSEKFHVDTTIQVGDVERRLLNFVSVLEDKLVELV